MTTPQKSKNADPLYSIKAAYATGILKQLISPLEEAAFRHSYKPFTYPIFDHNLYVNGWACRQLQEATERKLRIFESIEFFDRHSTNIPFKHREAFNDPRIILSLHARLRNRLVRLECYTLFTIMLKGRQFFEEQNFSQKAIVILEGLFAGYQCHDLFK